MHKIKVILFSVIISYAIYIPAVAAITKAPIVPKQKANPVSQNVHFSIPPPWTKVALTVNLPPPFKNATVVIQRKKTDDGEMVVSKIVVLTPSHKIVVPEKLIKNLIEPNFPEIGYRRSNVVNGELTKFDFVLKYGRMIRAKTPICNAPKCSYFRIARFVVDKDGHVTRNNDTLLPFGGLGN